jgi:hypothetical protein
VRPMDFGAVGVLKLAMSIRILGAAFAPPA